MAERTIGTPDHSLVSELVQQGAMTASQAEQSNRRHIVSRAIGVELSVKPSVRRLDIEDGDWLLLCTDGLTSMLHDVRIAEMMRAASGKVSLAAELLVQSANRVGGLDNITLVLVAIV